MLQDAKNSTRHAQFGVAVGFTDISHTRSALASRRADLRHGKRPSESSTYGTTPKLSRGRLGVGLIDHMYTWRLPQRNMQRHGFSAGAQKPARTIST